MKIEKLHRSLILKIALFSTALCATSSAFAAQSISKESPFKWEIRIENGAAQEQFLDNKSVSKILSKAYVNKKNSSECKFEYRPPQFKKAKTANLGDYVIESIGIACTVKGIHVFSGEALCSHFPKFGNSQDLNDSKELNIGDLGDGGLFISVACFPVL